MSYFFPSPWRRFYPAPNTFFASCCGGEYFPVVPHFLLVSPHGRFLLPFRWNRSRPSHPTLFFRSIIAPRCDLFPRVFFLSESEALKQQSFVFSLSRPSIFFSLQRFAPTSSHTPSFRAPSFFPYQKKKRFLGSFSQSAVPTFPHYVVFLAMTCFFSLIE